MLLLLDLHNVLSNAARLLSAHLEFIESVMNSRSVASRKVSGGLELSQVPEVIRVILCEMCDANRFLGTIHWRCKHGNPLQIFSPPNVNSTAFVSKRANVSWGMIVVVVFSWWRKVELSWAVPVLESGLQNTNTKITRCRNTNRNQVDSASRKSNTDWSITQTRAQLSSGIIWGRDLNTNREAKCAVCGAEMNSCFQMQTDCATQIWFQKIDKSSLWAEPCELKVVLVLQFS